MELEYTKKHADLKYTILKFKMVAKIKILFFIFILKINAYTRIDKDVYISNDACTGIYTLALMNETRAYQFIKYMEKWKFEDDEFYVNYKKYHSCEIIMWSSEVDYSNPIEVDDCHQRPPVNIYAN